MKFRWTVVIGLSWMSLGLGCRQRGGTVAPPPVAVRLLKIRTMPLRAPIIVFGQTEAYQQSNLAFQVTGVVERVNVEEGDPVEQGKVLASLDKESVRLNLRLSKARYYEAAASYRKAKKGYRKEIVQQYSAAYKRSKAAYQQAYSHYLSNEKLRKTGAVSEEQFTTAKANYDSARASMNQAYQAYQMYLRGYEKEDIQMAGVKTSQAHTQVALAQKQLRDTELQAPFSGVIAQKSIGVGELASPQKPSFTLMDLSMIRIRVGVPERVIQHTRLGQEAIVFFEPGVIAAVGTLARKGVVIDRATLTYPVEIEVKNPVVGEEGGKPVRRLLPGKVALVAFPRQGAPQGIALPLDAVLVDGANKMVFVQEKNKAKRVLVKTGETHNNQIVITEGLRDGMEVVVVGQHQLEPGRGLYVIDTKVPPSRDLRPQIARFQKEMEARLKIMRAQMEARRKAALTQERTTPPTRRAPSARRHKAVQQRKVRSRRNQRRQQKATPRRARRGGGK